MNSWFLPKVITETQQHPKPYNGDYDRLHEEEHKRRLEEHRKRIQAELPKEEAKEREEIYQANLELQRKLHRRHPQLIT
jgi:vacuolar-type H+-ATPase subunit E/Vma4